MFMSYITNLMTYVTSQPSRCLFSIGREANNSSVLDAACGLAGRRRPP